MFTQTYKFFYLPSKHFKVFSTLLSGWYDVTTLGQLPINVVSFNVELYNIEQRWVNVVNFNVNINNVRQRQNNVVISNIKFHDVDQRRNNVVKLTICKKLKRANKYLELKKEQRNWIRWTLSLDYYFIILLALFPILR